MSQSVFIVSARRTPLGSFGGSLAQVSAPELGSVAIRAALESAGLPAEKVEEVYMGCVLQAGLGQAPARQAARFAGIPDTVPCTTVNKVCASGLKSVMLAAQAIRAGEMHLLVAGGMENMSRVPYYVENARYGYRLGHGQLVDGLVKDGLTDVYHQYHMGNAAELCARECGISREEQDAYAMESYRRARQAWENGWFDAEIAPVRVPQKKGEPILVSRDEEYTQVDFQKIPTLKPVFQKDGTVTAANASTINDGAAALVVASEEMVKELGLRPLARILSYADAEQAPEWFTTSPAKALPLALHKAGLQPEQIDYWEINEAFSVVALANQKILKIPSEKLNIQGGAVSLGHPLGASGARILVTLVHILQRTGARYGAVGICNGGGGASAMVIERC
ncbi:MAG: acetyl-CoA C-acyltransferase [Flavobacteriales bacterium]|nr:acetyl-CoA C-acyltransferase [Flavobacteriales bacterium]MCX7768904.1 acetyl-CoA C-acyltransferase [Flavobacteriales bacterium]MDW8410030.1 acetyl-CoA C-acyltransferase [Flavobacteriales bacterium]